MVKSLEVRDVSKRFAGVVALDSVSLSIPRGRISAIIGPNGAGKTTVFNIITGYLRPSAGSCLLNGTPITGWPPNRVANDGVRRTFQMPRVFGSLSVRENVELGYGMSTREAVISALFRRRQERKRRAEWSPRVMEYLALVGLEDAAAVPAHRLGYAERKMVEIARILASGAEFILLDEPLSGIHSAARGRVMDVISGLPRHTGAGVCMIEHNVGAVMALAEQITVLDHGKVLAVGDSSSIRNNEAVMEAYLGTRSAE